MAVIERPSSIAYFTTEFDFTRGFAQWHVCWHIDQMAIGARSKQFTTRVIDGKDSVKNQWVLEIVKGFNVENGMTIRLQAMHPNVPTLAIIRMSMFHYGNIEPAFSIVDYTVFSIYAQEFTCPLPSSERRRETTLKRQRCGCGGNSSLRTDTELHCWLSFPIDLVAKRAYFSKLISYSFGRETWPVKSWYEAVLICCFTADRHRNAQWKAMTETHCESLPNLEAICLVQVAGVTELPCCARPQAKKSPKSAQTTLLLSQLKDLKRSRRSKRKRRHASGDKKSSNPLELQAEQLRMKSLARSVETLDVGSKAHGCACAIL